MDKGSYYTQALGMLGDRRYVPGTAEAEACDGVGGQVIGIALDYARWSFATRRAELELDSKGEARLPDDCMRVQDCGLARWEKRGRSIYAAEGYWSGEAGEKFEITYTSDIWAQAVCLPEKEPLFCEACVMLLAAKIAPRLTSQFDLAVQLEQRGMEMLYRAKLKDAQSTDSKDQEPMTAEELMYGTVC